MLNWSPSGQGESYQSLGLESIFIEMMLYAAEHLAYSRHSIDAIYAVLMFLLLSVFLQSSWFFFLPYPIVDAAVVHVTHIPNVNSFADRSFRLNYERKPKHGMHFPTTLEGSNWQPLYVCGLQTQLGSKVAFKSFYLITIPLNFSVKCFLHFWRPLPKQTT